MTNRLSFPLCLLAGIAAVGCVDSAPSEQEVVVFAALDREFSEPILDRFEASTQIEVRARYDIESTKTVGLVSRIMSERRPTCDVFWNNEILHTIRLQKLGLLDPYRAPNAAAFPPDYRADDDRWYGLAARARVLLVNTDLVPPADWPDSIHDLTDPKWKNEAGMAKPFFGTTATHAAVLFSQWEDDAAQDYYRRVAANCQILSGNKQVAAAVGRGQLKFGITDTDDAIIERDQGRPVAILFPDQGEDQPGALFIPNSLCIIRNGPHPKAARQLVNYLLSPEVETALAEGRSAQFPVNPAVTAQSRAFPEGTLKWMPVDFEAAADHWETTMEFLRTVFLDAS